MKLTRRSFIRVLICGITLALLALYQLPQRLWFYLRSSDSLLAALAPSSRTSVEVQRLVLELGQHPSVMQLQQIELTPKRPEDLSSVDFLEAQRTLLGQVPQAEAIELSSWVLSKNEAVLLLQSAN